MTPAGRLFHAVAWLSLGCHVLVASGLPVPLAARRPGDADAAARKDRSRPFPCMDRPCGCATAERCLTRCCCHTPAQTLAWARAHGVEPAVLAALERRAGAAPAEGRCAPATCAAVDPDAPEVCGEYRSLAADAAPDPAPEPAAGGVRVVILRDVLACEGILAAWFACIAAPPPPRVAAPAHDLPAGRVALLDERRLSVSADRSTPPPRAS